MKITSEREVTEKKQQLLGVEDAHFLWDLLAQRYFIIDIIKLLENFSHDKDFKYIIHNHLSVFENEVTLLEKELATHSIKAPYPNVVGMNVAGNSEITVDERTAQLLYHFLKENLSKLVRTLKHSGTNDRIRKIFLKMIKTSLKQVDEYVRYLKLKGWIEFPPLYQYVKGDVTVQVSAIEIYQLWEHLVFRYANIELTALFEEVAYDDDFKLMLKIGRNFLQKQAKKIERLLIHYGVTLPHKYAKVVPKIEAREAMNDKFMFNTILTGIQSATTLHGIAIQEVIVNDQIRKFFAKLLFGEIKMIDRMIKYGKIKGWITQSPFYKMG